MRTIRHRFSKHQFPTHVASTGRQGSLQLGRDAAERELRQRVARRLGTLVHSHTRTQWIIDEYPREKA